MNPIIKKVSKAYTPWQISYFVSGKKFRQYRKTKTAAVELRADLLKKHGQFGSHAFELSQSQIADATRAMAMLEDRTTLVEAADFWIRNADAASDVTIEEVATEFLDARKEGTTKVYQSFLKVKVDRFVESFGADRRIGTITTREVGRYLEAQPFAAESVANIRRALVTLFSFALKQEYISKNPAKNTAAPRIVRGMPQFFSKSDLDKLLKTCRAIDPELETPLALSAFFGVRSHEVTRLKDSDIDRANKTILIRAEVAKTHHPRLIENLPDRCWQSITKPHLVISPKMLITRRAKIYKKAKIEWFNSALRKTFISHAVAAFQSAERVALVVGHRQTSTLHTHYRGLVSHAQGNEYFNIQEN